MARRTKNEMELMHDDASYYLLQTNNNYHKAYDLFIKDHLENNKTIPYYIKGIKDFLVVSQSLAVKLNRKEQMNKVNKQYAEKQEIIKDFILNLSIDEMKVIYKSYKDTVHHSDKLILVDAYTLIFNNEMNEKHISQTVINLFTTIYNEQTEKVTA
jgi:hypothetical protein